MAYYIILLFFYCFLGLLEINGSLKVKKRSWYTLVLLIPMACLVAFRADHIGNDTYIYKLIYDNTANALSYKALLMGRFELGYGFISYILGSKGYSFLVFQAVVAFVTFGLLGIFIYRYTPHIAASCFFVSSGVMYSAMNTMRMELAIVILLLSIPYIQKKQFAKFLGVVFIAFLFHKSSIIFLIMYPLGALKYNRFTTFFIVSVSIIIAFMGVSFFQFVTSELEMYENYTKGEYFSEDRSVIGVTIKFTETLLIMLLFWYTHFLNIPQYISSKLNGKIISFAYISRMAYWIVLACGILGFTNNLMHRVSGYFSIMTIVMIPYAISCVKSKNRRQAIFLMLAFFFIAERIVIWIFRPGWNRVIPYEWGW